MQVFFQMQQMLLLALSKHVKELGAAGRVGAAVEQRGSEVAKTYEVASLSFEVSLFLYAAPKERASVAMEAARTTHVNCVASRLREDCC